MCDTQDVLQGGTPADPWGIKARPSSRLSPEEICSPTHQPLGLNPASWG